MPRNTVFHSRLARLNQTGIWKNWSGYLVAPAYQHSVLAEYYAIRNAVSLLDTSPLFKYRVAGPGAGDLLRRVMARNIDDCPPGKAQYTVWCDPRGFVLQDGVVLGISDGEYRFTAAEPALRYFRQQARELKADVRIEDISEAWGILALQGPHAYRVLGPLCETDISRLNYFDCCETRIGSCPVTVSRTGFTGDLGYEIWIRREDAETVWDALAEAGRGFNITPIGTTALKMARVEAGLLLLDVDFHSSRHAWVDQRRDTPGELGWNWMFRKLSGDDRDFVGRAAIEAQRAGGGRWTTVGLEVDWHEYERAFLDAGIMPAKHEVYQETTMSIYRRCGDPWVYAGYASSFLFSSLLQRPIAIAKLPTDLARSGTEVDLEISVIRRPVNVLARVCKLPFYNPPRKTAAVDGG